MTTAIIICVWFILLLIIGAILKANKVCSHEPEGTGRKVWESVWYDYTFTMPHEALKGEKFRVYRRDIKLEFVCKHCGEKYIVPGYDQKVHETDTMHRTPKNFNPDPMPEALTPEDRKTLVK